MNTLDDDWRDLDWIIDSVTENDIYTDDIIFINKELVDVHHWCDVLIPALINKTNSFRNTFRLMDNDFKPFNRIDLVISMSYSSDDFSLDNTFEMIINGDGNASFVKKELSVNDDVTIDLNIPDDAIMRFLTSSQV